MSRIFKAVLHPGGSQHFPAARLLSVGWQGQDLCLWYETGTRIFEVFVVPTGDNVPPDATFIGTAQSTAFEGDGFPFMVFHVYAAAPHEDSDGRR